MSVLKILRWPDRALSAVCSRVDDVEEVRDLVRDMFETMYDAPGRGLAAPQVGVLKRVFVMDVGWKSGSRTPMVCINPEIVSTSDVVVEGEEGCLSIPGVLASVSRPDVVTLCYTDLGGTRQEERLDGFAARCAQHELDHLDGVVTLDRLGPEARADMLSRYEAAT